MSRRVLSDRSGNAAIEFALLFPALAVALLGLIQGSELLWLRNTLKYSTEEAGRFAMGSPTASAAQIVSVAKQKLPGIDPKTVTVTTATDASGGVNFVTITASLDVKLLEIMPQTGLTLSAYSRVPLPQ
ncbi:MAG TPA: TadE/TadG family type IV pilus assembly protein [Stellaceae bacterium]|jgi:Flp pilus assembly protein TadG